MDPMSSDGPAARPDREALERELERLGLSIAEDARDALVRHLELVDAWNERAGLTAIDDPVEAARRLSGESLALLVALRESGLLPAGQHYRVADIGPGGGVPGIPMRIVEPVFELVMVEAQARRCAFLEAVVEELGLSGVRVVNARAEDAGRDAELRASFDLVVARAVAPLAVLVEYALPLLREGGVLATPKGSRASEELAEASEAIAALGGLALDPLPLSLPDDAPPQQVLLVRRVGALDDRYPRRAGVPSRRPL
jgi:16S rRNA (guanine527-N7)-methyltransferase